MDNKKLLDYLTLKKRNLEKMIETTNNLEEEKEYESQRYFIEIMIYELDL